jgi:hypothetical protein
MTTINNIGHANKDIIRLTETLRTSLLTLANSIYIIGGSDRIRETYAIPKNSEMKTSKGTPL